MRAVYFHLLLWVQWCSMARAWSHVSKADLQQTLVSDDHVLVAFVWPGEGSTESLEPEWDTAAETTHEKLISFDCTVDVATCQALDVKSYPEIHLSHNNRRVARYNGPKRAAAILHFIARMKRPAISDVTADTLTDFQTADETVFLAYLDPGDPQSQKAFDDIAQRYREEFTFGVAVSDVKSPSGITPPAVICYKPIDGEVTSFSFANKLNKLEKWILEASSPMMAELTILNHQRLRDLGRPMVYLFAATVAQRQSITTSLAKFAKSYHSTLTIVLVNPFDFPGLSSKLGLGEDPIYPAGAVHQLSNDKIYPYPKGLPITPSALQKWGLDVYQGKVKPWMPEGSEESVTTGGDDLGRKRGIQIGRTTAHVSIAKGWPGVKIKVAGRDEL